MERRDDLESVLEESRKFFYPELRAKMFETMLKLLKYRLHGGEKREEAIKRFFHVLKGTGTILELKDIAKIGKAYEAYIEEIKQEGHPTDPVFSTLLKGVAEVQEFLEKQGEAFKEEEIESQEGPCSGEASITSEEYTNLTQSGRILIVDEDVAALDLLERTFRKEGYYVVISSKPEEAVSIVKEKQIDLLLLESRLPRMDGFTVLEQLQEAALKLPVLFMSASSSREDKSKALQAGAKEYIIKPFEVCDVVEKVEDCLKSVSHYGMDFIRDHLTGAYTQKYFNERIAEAMERLKGKKEVFSVALLNIDEFKGINDGYSYFVGDHILQSFVGVLKKHLRGMDQVYRFGGNEFLILFPDTVGKEAYRLLENIRKVLAEDPFRYKEMEKCIEIAFSAGIATVQNPKEAAEHLLEALETALYRCKNESPGTTVFLEEMKASLERKKKILLVDDENIIHQMIRMRLSSAQYEIHSANNGESGLKKALAIQPDLILLDLMLPKLSGFELCKQVKENPKTGHTKIIVLSAKNKEEDIVRCFELGADEYMIKPFSLLELEQRMKKLLKNKERKA